jgi:hypothetical protein
MNALTLRFALPTVVIVAIVTVMAVAILFATHTLHIPGVAGGSPCC